MTASGAAAVQIMHQRGSVGAGDRSHRLGPDRGRAGVAAGHRAPAVACRSGRAAVRSGHGRTDPGYPPRRAAISHTLANKPAGQQRSLRPDLRQRHNSGPVGPPDEAARAAIRRNYVAQITDADVDIDRLVRATQLFTPADIDFAARKAAQAAFERAVLQDAPPESGQQLDSAAQPSMTYFALSPRPGRR